MGRITIVKQGEFSGLKIGEELIPVSDLKVQGLDNGSVNINITIPNAALETEITYGMTGKGVGVCSSRGR